MFEMRERTDPSRGRRSESTFAFLDRSSQTRVGEVRDKINEMLENSGTPDELWRRFSGNDDRQTDGAFLELYLQEIFRRSGCRFSSDRTTGQGESDLALVVNDRLLYVEATALQKKQADIGESRRADALLEYLEDHLNFRHRYLQLFIDSIGTPEPSKRKLKDALQKWIDSEPHASEKFSSSELAVEVHCEVIGQASQPVTRFVLPGGPDFGYSPYTADKLYEVFQRKRRQHAGREAPLLICVNLPCEAGYFPEEIETAVSKFKKEFQGDDVILSVVDGLTLWNFVRVVPRVVYNPTGIELPSIWSTSEVPHLHSSAHMEELWEVGPGWPGKWDRKAASV